MNKKAITPYTIIFWLISATVIYVMFASEQIKYWGVQAVIQNNLTGVEAFAYSNLNFVVYCMMFIFCFALFYVTSN